MTDTLGSIGAGSRVGRGDLVIFDLDGTLTDSAEGIVASFRHALRTVGAVAHVATVDELRGVLGV